MGPAPPEWSLPDDLFRILTHDSRRLLGRAQQASERLGFEFVSATCLAAEAVGDTAGAGGFAFRAILPEWRLVLSYLDLDLVVMGPWQNPPEADLAGLVERAQRLARACRVRLVGTEFLLYAMLTDRRGCLAAALRACEAPLDKTRRAFEERVGIFPQGIAPQLGFAIRRVRAADFPVTLRDHPLARVLLRLQGRLTDLQLCRTPEYARVLRTRPESASALRAAVLQEYLTFIANSDYDD